MAYSSCNSSTSKSPCGFPIVDPLASVLLYPGTCSRCIIGALALALALALVLTPVLALLNRPTVLAVDIAGRKPGPVLSKLVILVLHAIVLFSLFFFFPSVWSVVGVLLVAVLDGSDIRWRDVIARDSAGIFDILQPSIYIYFSYTECVLDDRIQG